MSSTLTSGGWVVENDVVDERNPLPRLTQAQIDALNARIAAGSNEFPTGTRIVRVSDEAVFQKEGVGTAGAFVPVGLSSLRSEFAAADGSVGVGFQQDGAGAETWDAQGKMREHVSILDYMTPNQRSAAIAGTMAMDMTLPIQKAIDYLETRGGGALGWYDVMVTGTLTIQCSDITIRPLGGNRLRQAGNTYNTFRVYPASLDSIWSGSGRAAGFENGIDGAPETLMYESDDTKRLRNVRILDLDFEFTGTGAYGRFVDAFSVDRMVVRGCKGVSGSNVLNLWYCRDAEVEHNDLTASSSTFCIFMFKSHGSVAHNTTRNGVHGIEAKGTYPQAGKTVYQGFDAGYEFWHPIKIHHNKIIQPGDNGVQVGYYDNSTADISSGTATGVTKSQWYGEMWGAEICDNSITYSETMGVQKAGIRLNVNTRFAKVQRNTLIGAGITTFGSRDSEITENTLINHRATSTAAIEVSGFTTGAVSRNSQRITIARNRIVGHARQAVALRGGDYCDVLDNQIANGTTGFVQIDVNSSNSASTSTGNHVLCNRITSTAADFAHPIRSQNAAGTVIDENRAYGGWYSGNALDSDGFADANYKRGVVSADTANVYVGSAGTCSVGQNFGDQNASSAVTGYGSAMAYNGMVGGSAYRQAVRFGAHFLWVDSGGKLRIKSTKPTSDTDGTVVGTQT